MNSYDINSNNNNNNIFDYQYIRNGSGQGQNSPTRSISALSSTDYIQVLVKPRANNNCISWTGPLVSNGTITNGYPSNFLFFSEPKYTFEQPENTPAVNICSGENVEIEFSRGIFKWTEVNAEISWILRRNNVPYTLQTIAIPNNATEEELDQIFTITTEEIKQGLESQNPPVSPVELLDGDVVYFEYLSDIDREVRRKCNTNTEVNRSAEVPIIVNDITATATLQEPVICIGGTATFNVNATITGTAAVTYEWNVEGTTYTTTGPSLTISNPENLTEGVYDVSVTVSNSCETIPLTVGDLTVNPAPQVSLSFVPRCGTTTLVSATPGAEGTYTYAWTVPDGVTDPGNVDSFETSVSGDYSVTITNSSDCSVSDAENITVDPLVEQPTTNPHLEVTWINEGTQWEVEAVFEAVTDTS